MYFFLKRMNMEKNMMGVIILLALNSALFSCASTERVIDDRLAELNTPEQQMMERHEQEPLSSEDIVRIGFQEWLDHHQRAWVPVEIVSELALNWPKKVHATQIVVTQHEVTIQVTSIKGAQALKSAMGRGKWLKDVKLSETLVTGQVVAVERVLAPDSDVELLAEIDRLTNGKDGVQFSPSRPIFEMNDAGQLDQETDAFNCWHRVMKLREGYESMDGTWIEAQKTLVRPDKPKISVGKWVELPDKEKGKAWVRNRALKELRGPFPVLVQGLDCLKSTRVRYGVRKIEFQSDPSFSGGAILEYEIDLFLNLPLDPNRETPWGKGNSWGEAERPKRARTLKDRTLVNPFAG